jgi:hypothetical protein
VCIVTITLPHLFLVIALWVIYLSSSDLPMLVSFLVFHQLMRKHLVILVDMVSGCITFSESPCLARKCGTHKSDSPIRAL